QEAEQRDAGAIAHRAAQCRPASETRHRGGAAQGQLELFHARHSTTARVNRPPPDRYTWLMAASIFDHNLENNPANYAPLTPLSFLERAASVYPERVSVIHGAERHSWAETYARCRRLASALAKRGIGAGHTVAAMLPNTPPMYECHFGVAMAGAVLNTLNTRLDVEAIAFMLEHGEARLLITDPEFAPTIEAALRLLKKKITVVDAIDAQFSGGKRLG